MIKDYIIQQYSFGKTELQLAVPDVDVVQQEYHLRKKQNALQPFPFWAQVWSSAIALCQFIHSQPQYINNKDVVELAAGLGLPSILVSEYARSVYCTDYSTDSMPFIKKSIELNQKDNINFGILDWNALPADVASDVVLLSDVNYDTTQFEMLYKVFISFLNKGSAIIMTTPQRLMAKPFIEKILPYVIEQEELLIGDTLISVFVLKIVVKR